MSSEATADTSGEFVDTRRLMQDLTGLIPIKALPPAYFQRIASTAEYHELNTGDYVMRAGQCDNAAVYLLRGKVEILKENGKTELLDASTFPAKYPIAPAYPRQADVRALTPIRIVNVSRNLLDIFLTWCQSAPDGSATLDTARDSDWIMRMLQLTLFQKLPPENLQTVIERMEAMPVEQGQVIIEQGTPGDYYYVVRRGHAAVTRKVKGQDKPVKLAELAEGDSFGEEALVSGTKRNANVIMLSAGVLMRLAKSDFLDLIKQPLENEIDYYLAESKINDGGIWLDVRLPDEYRNGHFINSLNLPLPALRMNTNRLDPKRVYVLYCDTGRRSASAAFLLQQAGFESYVLGGGLMNLPGNVFLARGTDERPNKSQHLRSMVRSRDAVQEAGRYDNTDTFKTGNEDAAQRQAENRANAAARGILDEARAQAEAVRLQAQHEAAMIVENARAAAAGGIRMDDSEIRRLHSELEQARNEMADLHAHNKQLQRQIELQAEKLHQTTEVNHLGTMVSTMVQQTSNKLLRRLATLALLAAVAGVAYYLGSALRTQGPEPHAPAPIMEQPDPRKSAG